MPSYSSGVNWYWPPEGRPLMKTLTATSPPPPSALIVGTELRMSAWLFAVSIASLSSLNVVAASGVSCAARARLVPVMTTSSTLSSSTGGCAGSCA
jgi:hypothetical protein